MGILGGAEMELIHNHHNFAWKERHGGEDLIVVAKGRPRRSQARRDSSADRWATTAVILEGSSADSDAQKRRDVLDRPWGGPSDVAHAGGGQVERLGRKRQLVAPGMISQEMLADWIGPMGVILRAVGSMRRRRPTAGCRMCSLRRATPSRSFTRLRR